MTESPFQSKCAWLTGSASAFDFRGDVRTSPTAEMLSAVTHTSMGDGVEGADEITNVLQNYIAILTSHEAALFVLSGTMGNLLALRCHLTTPPYTVLCDSRAHFLNTEAGGIFTWTGAVAQPVQASNGRHLTLEDILPHVKLDDGVSVHAVPTRFIIIENTLVGLITPFAEAQRICEFAHENGIKVHLDGARFWEAATAETDSLDETKQYLKECCRLFDSVTMCFSKGFGAPVGAILVGQKTFIRRATWLRQSLGGSVRQSGLISACAYVAVKQTFEGGLLKRTHLIGKDIATFWVEQCKGLICYMTSLSDRNEYGLA